jgi:hypothetical protein
LLGSPAPGKGSHAAVAAPVALLGSKLFVHQLDGAAITLAAVCVGLEPGSQLFGEAVELGLPSPAAGYLGSTISPLRSQP